MMVLIMQKQHLQIKATITWDVSTSPVAKVTLNSKQKLYLHQLMGLLDNLFLLLVIQDGTGSSYTCNLELSL
jgi:hypothetical protein